MTDIDLSGRFVILPIEAISDHRLGLIELRVLAALYSFRGGADITTVYPSRERLAERSGYSLTTVSKAMKGLIQTGWVSSQQHRGPNTYTLRGTQTVASLETVSDTDTVAGLETVSDTDTVSESGINSGRSGHETVAESATPEETKKRPEEETTRRNGVPPCPHSEIIRLYHEILPELPGVQIARWHGSTRARDLQARWREDDRHRDTRFWAWFFEAVRADPFYLGENARRWRADLAWLLNRSNFDKVIERAADQRRRNA